jgi:ferredoxin
LIVEISAILLIAFGLAIVIGFGAFGTTSVHERQQRAARVSFALAIALSLPLLLTALLPAPFRLTLLGVTVLVTITGAILLLLPIGRVERGNDVPRSRIDERDTMFARADLKPGSPNYKAYYTLHPEHETGDERTRELPGLLSPDASETNPLVFAATDATFDLIETLRGAVDGEPASPSVECDAQAMSAYIKGLATYWGAHTVGIAELQPYHIYSHIGRGRDQYGAPVTLNHRHAIAFAVEMDHALVSTAPAAPTLLESARQYANAAQIAIQLANLIRSQGYPARAHIDGNYRVIAPLVARDAGLGEIGRMGLLMTPALGPRVRLGVVTTDLPLTSDPRTNDPSVLDFCRVCRKCADNCPVRAIPLGDREEIDGALRWRINQDVCYRYWCITGTDCARCMALCPYSYPPSPLHNLVRRAVRRSGAARRAAIWLDRVFYGHTPASQPAPSWVPPRAVGDRRRNAPRYRASAAPKTDHEGSHAPR